MSAMGFEEYIKSEGEVLDLRGYQTILNYDDIKGAVLSHLALPRPSIKIMNTSIPTPIYHFLLRAGLQKKWHRERLSF